MGFLDVYHDTTLADIRQDERLYQVFTYLLKSKKLWVTFDRVILQNADDSDDPLPPHVDQNPNCDPEFLSLQGIIALRDMNEKTGTLALIPRSKAFFHKYKEWHEDEKGSYVEYQDDDLPIFEALCLKEGELVIWDSRTTHSRFRMQNATENRYAMLVSFVLASEENGFYCSLRKSVFKQGTGHNLPFAGLRATSRPRCEISLRQKPEMLTEHGKRVYGQSKWKDNDYPAFILPIFFFLVISFLAFCMAKK